MRKAIHFIVYAAVLAVFTAVPVSAQDYSRLDGAPYDPETDVDMDLFISHWEESMPRHVHGTLVVRDIFTPLAGDPLNPDRRGAVLTMLREYCHATLEAGVSTLPSTLTGEQKLFYFQGGRGTMSAGGDTAEVCKGIAVLVPENLEFILENTGGEPLSMYIMTEPVPGDFVPRTSMVVKNENTTGFNMPGVHWSNYTKLLFSSDDGLATITGMAPVWLFPGTMAQPHTARRVGCDILWVALEGKIQTLLGKELRYLRPGTAFKNPADGRVYHANINVTDEPVKLLWMRTKNPE